MEEFRNNRHSHSWKMQQVYEYLSVSRQAIHKKLKRQKVLAEEGCRVLKMAEEIRKSHRIMGCRKMAKKLVLSLSVGRDKTEMLLLENGFRVKYPKNYRRTTYSAKTGFFPNLIEGMEINNINRVWQTDITYIHAHGRFYYLATIIDVYSRRITGWAIDSNMRASLVIAAFKRAIKERGNTSLQGLVLHSDRGSQYINKEFIALVKNAGATQSMCLEAWQNAYAERVQGTVKNEYLEHYSTESGAALARVVKRSIYLYNNERPHLNLLNEMAPNEFEKKILTLSCTERPTVRLYTEKSLLTGVFNPRSTSAQKDLLKRHYPKKLLNIKPINFN